MTATLYSYADASAPTLGSSGGGDLRAILKAVLIDGYGSRTPVGGWTAPYDDAVNHKIVLKHPNRSAYLRIDDNIAYQFAHGSFFRTMTDIDNGTDEVPNATSMAAGQTHFLSKRYLSSSPTEQWHMLVEDSGKWFYFWTPHQSYPAGFFFGDVEPYADSPIYSPVLLTGSDDTSGLSTNDFRYGLFDNGVGNWYMQDDRFRLFDRGGEETRQSFEDASITNPSPLDGKIYYAPIRIIAHNTPLLLYGDMPNFYRSFGNPQVFINHEKFVMGGKNYIALDWNSGSYIFQFDADS